MAYDQKLADADRQLRELKEEIERLQSAKRAALAIADERSRENVALRAAERERCAGIVESHLGATTETKHLVGPLVASIRRADQ